MKNIILKNISKKYNYVLFQNVNLELNAGEIVAFTGPNGCGKTVLLKIIAGLVKPSSGNIYYDDINELGKENKILPSLGCFFDRMDFFGELSAYENLEILASLRGKIGKKEIVDALNLVGLDHENKLPVKKYSLGMKQKLGLAQAIMEEIDVLILDEPTNALDDATTKKIYDILLSLKEKGKIILITSHNNEDLKILADTVYTFRGDTLEKEEI